jgi:hypothetical protein
MVALKVGIFTSSADKGQQPISAFLLIKGATYENS